MRIGSIIIVFACLLEGLAQTNTFRRTYGDFENFNQGYAAAVDELNNIYVAGGSAGFGAQNGDMWLMKTDSLGTVLWHKVYGGINADIAQSICRSTQGGFVLCGHTASFGEGGYDIFVVAVDDNGNELWRKTYGGPDWEIGRRIIPTSDGHYAMIGTTYSFGEGNADVWVLKINGQDGELIWERTFGTAADETGNGICELEEGNLMVVSTFENLATGKDFFIAKLSPDGDVLFERTFGGPGNQYANDVAPRINNGFAVGGSLESAPGMLEYYPVNFNSEGEFLDAIEGFGGNFSPINRINYIGDNRHLILFRQRAGNVEFGNLWKTFPGFFLDCSSSFGHTFPYTAEDAIMDNSRNIIIIGNSDFLSPGQSSVYINKSDENCFVEGGIQVNIHEPKAIQDIKVYPNPAENWVGLQSKSFLFGPETQVQIIDVLGKTVELPFDMVNSYEVVLHLERKLLHTGNYTLKISNKYSVQISRIVLR
ncbi:MAG: T9SS type A sorting domain-containing protein [Flavobacteriales bacterium]